jgi:UDP-N-acetyl-D-mannosaminuronic acid dehydrogenase
VIFEKVCVLGLGYIGLPTACTFATHGVEVIGVDVNPRIVDTLQNGGLHINEPGLRNLVESAISSKNLQFKHEPEQADAFIIAVPTPFRENKHADLSFVKSAAEAIVSYLQPENLIVLESTSPPRTTIDVVAPILDVSGLKTGSDFMLAYSPERVLPGKILHELIHNARVIGGVNHKSAEAGRDLYSIFVKGEIVLTDSTTAEMVKLMENTQRDVNIALANEFGRLADRFGVDIWEAIRIANRHPRVKILNPGPGVGGHCIGVDPWFLVESAPEIATLIRTAREVNDDQPEYVVKIIRKSLGISDSENLAGKELAILGLTYKPEVDDIRQSPSIRIGQILSDQKARVKAYDPYIMERELDEITVENSWRSAVQNSNLIVLLVAHTSLLEIDPYEMLSRTGSRKIVDAVNGWNTADWNKAGFEIIKMGSPKRSEQNYYGERSSN